MDRAAGARASRGVVAGLAAVALVLVTAGCLPGIGRDAGHSSSSTTSATPSGSANPSGSNAAGTLTTFTATIPKGSDNLITQDQTEVYRVAITALYRAGPFTRMGFTVTCVTPPGDQCEPWQDFDGGTFNTYGGIYLVDPVGHKSYYPVEESDSSPFTSRAGWVDPGKSEDGWAVFPATPASASTLDVIWPGDTPVAENVPLSEPRPETQKAPVEEDFDKPQDTTDATGLTMPTHDLYLHSKSEGTEEKQKKDRRDVTLSADVLFAFGKATLTSKAAAILQRVAQQMSQNATGTVDVTGYTDAKGTPKVNNPLSLHRAQAVSNYLKKSVRRDLTYAVKGKGESDPVAPNTKSDGGDNPKGRAKNRRVTISYKIQPPKPSTSPSPSASSTRQPATPKPTTWVTSVTRNDGDDTYQVTVEDVRRHGDLAILEFRLKCVKVNEGDGCWTLDALQGSAGSSDLQGTSGAGGFTLYQAAGKTHFYPLIDSEYDPLTSHVGDTLTTGTERGYWVYYPAPDPGVTAVDVLLPHGGPTVHDVPVV